MNNKPYRVHVILDPSYGTRLHNLPPGEPAWVIDSELNHPIVQEIWNSQKTTNHLEGLTAFKYNKNGNPESWLLDELQTIDLHHGEQTHKPPYSVINVIGTVCTDLINRELKEYGFVKYEPTPDGFMAIK